MRTPSSLQGQNRIRGVSYNCETSKSVEPKLGIVHDGEAGGANFFEMRHHYFAVATIWLVSSTQYESGQFDQLAFF